MRRVFQADWVRQPGGLLFEIRANAFLYHMVRRTVFLLVQAGGGRLSLENLGQAVTRAQPQTPGLAPAQGLVLTRVEYDTKQDDWIA